MKSLCVSLETAKALKAAGWTKPTAFVYAWPIIPAPHISEADNWELVATVAGWEIKDTILAAPTAEEILRELPEEINSYYLDIHKNDGNYAIAYQAQAYAKILKRISKISNISEAAAQQNGP